MVIVWPLGVTLAARLIVAGAVKVAPVPGAVSATVGAAVFATVMLAAAELTERVCYGIELDPKYVDVIVQRWQSLSGKKAVLEGDGRTFEEIAS